MRVMEGSCESLCTWPQVTRNLDPLICLLHSSKTPSIKEGLGEKSRVTSSTYGWVEIDSVTQQNPESMICNQANALNIAKMEALTNPLCFLPLSLAFHLNVILLEMFILLLYKT